MVKPSIAPWIPCQFCFVQRVSSSSLFFSPGYFKIARHYGWALNQTFHDFGYSQAIVVEDDLEVAPDFFQYFEATLPVLRRDRSLYCVSAWNDNGKAGIIDETRPELLYRSDFFGGLGWMLTKDTWEELAGKWPRSYWDDWIR